jgi:hypothetical protein
MKKNKYFAFCAFFKPVIIHNCLICPKLNVLNNLWSQIPIF